MTDFNAFYRDQRLTKYEQAEADACTALSKLSMKVVASHCNVLHYLKGFNTMPHEKKNNLFFGCELELPLIKNNYQERLKAINALTPDLEKYSILKAEGCCSYGFEIVTVPATLDFHRQVLWGKFFTYAKKHLTTDGGCGLHIHFSRHALKDDQLARMLCFVHDPHNKKFLGNIANRDRVHSAGKKYLGIGPIGIIASEERGRSALHISTRNKGKSCEFRIFRSQISEYGVMRCLEFTAALIEYCGICNNTEEALRYESFVEWFEDKQMGLSYAFLEKWLLSLKYIGKRASLFKLLKARKKV